VRGKAVLQDVAEPSLFAAATRQAVSETDDAHDAPIDKKSLFGIPQTASTRTDRKHAETGLEQRCLGGSMAEAGGNVNPTAKQRLCG
jgi:hypothetical protein